MFYKNRLPDDMTWESASILAFDKDNTITPANKPILPEVAKIIADITKEKIVIILTARDIHTCETQLLNIIKDYEPKLGNLVFGCSNGSQIFRYSSKEGKYVLRKELQGEMDLNHIADANKIINEAIGRNDMKFEQRSKTMGAFFPPRETLDDEGRKNFDPEKTLRNAAIEKLKNLQIFPKEYEIIAAGSTSIDVGIHDKEAGMRNLIEYFHYQPSRHGEILFFGDGFPGNDSPVLNIENINVVQVKNPNETMTLLTDLIKTKF